MTDWYPKSFGGNMLDTSPLSSEQAQTTGCNLLLCLSQDVWTIEIIVATQTSRTSGCSQACVESYDAIPAV